MVKAANFSGFLVLKFLSLILIVTCLSLSMHGFNQKEGEFYNKVKENTLYEYETILFPVFSRVIASSPQVFTLDTNSLYNTDPS